MRPTTSSILLFVLLAVGVNAEKVFRAGNANGPVPKITPNEFDIVNGEVKANNKYDKYRAFHFCSRLIIVQKGPGDIQHHQGVKEARQKTRGYLQVFFLLVIAFAYIH